MTWGKRWYILDVTDVAFPNDSLENQQLTGQSRGTYSASFFYVFLLGFQLCPVTLAVCLLGGGGSRRVRVVFRLAFPGGLFAMQTWNSKKSKSQRETCKNTPNWSKLNWNISQTNQNIKRPCWNRLKFFNSHSTKNKHIVSPCCASMILVASTRRSDRSSGVCDKHHEANKTHETQHHTAMLKMYIHYIYIFTYIYYNIYIYM